MRWLLLFALGCQQGRAPAPAPVPARAIDARLDAPVDAIIWDGPVAQVTIDDIVRGLATDNEPTQICFAVSANHRRVACSFDSEMWEGTLAATREVRILGDLGSASSEWNYLDTMTVPTTNESTVAAIDHAAIDDLRRALDQRHYQPFDATGVPLVSTATVGGRTLRRHRSEPGPPSYTQEDTVELACHASWVPIQLDDMLQVSQGMIEEVKMRVSAFDDRRILIELDSNVGYEGGHQIIRAAQLVDAAALCR